MVIPCLNMSQTIAHIHKGNQHGPKCQWHNQCSTFVHANHWKQNFCLRKFHEETAHDLQMKVMRKNASKMGCFLKMMQLCTLIDIWKEQHISHPCCQWTMHPCFLAQEGFVCEPMAGGQQIMNSCCAGSLCWESIDTTETKQSFVHCNSLSPNVENHLSTVRKGNLCFNEPIPDVTAAAVRAISMCPSMNKRRKIWQLHISAVVIVSHNGGRKIVSLLWIFHLQDCLSINAITLPNRSSIARDHLQVCMMPHSHQSAKQHKHTSQALWVGKKEQGGNNKTQTVYTCMTVLAWFWSWIN